MEVRARAIYVRATGLGLEMDTNRPGNGTRIYRFTHKSGEVTTLIGAAMAETYLKGYADGQFVAVVRRGLKGEG